MSSRSCLTNNRTCHQWAHGQASSANGHRQLAITRGVSHRIVYELIRLLGDARTDGGMAYHIVGCMCNLTGRGANKDPIMFDIGVKNHMGRALVSSFRSLADDIDAWRSTEPMSMVDSQLRLYSAWLNRGLVMASESVEYKTTGALPMLLEELLDLDGDGNGSFLASVLPRILAPMLGAHGQVTVYNRIAALLALAMVINAWKHVKERLGDARSQQILERLLLYKDPGGKQQLLLYWVFAALNDPGVKMQQDVVAFAHIPDTLSAIGSFLSESFRAELESQKRAAAFASAATGTRDAVRPAKGCAYPGCNITTLGGDDRSPLLACSACRTVQCE